MFFLVENKKYFEWYSNQILLSIKWWNIFIIEGYCYCTLTPLSDYFPNVQITLIQVFHLHISPIDDLVSIENGSISRRVQLTISWNDWASTNRFRIISRRSWNKLFTNRFRRHWHCGWSASACILPDIGVRVLVLSYCISN